MAASLDAIEAAIYAALGTLVAATPTSSAPFRHLRRYAGEVTQDLAAQIERGLYDLTPEQLPAALLAWVKDEPLGQNGAYVEEPGGAIQVVSRSTWRVYVVVRDLRGDEAALKGTLAGQPGQLLCAECVKRGLAGLHIDGLFENRGLRWLGSSPWVIARRTAYICALSFGADAELPESSAEDNPTPGVPLAGVYGTVPDATPDTNAAAVTLSSFSTLPDT